MESINIEVAQKPYEAPAIAYEASLEVRAGTPLGLPDPLNLSEQGD
jgi:hypothetical protein